MKHKPMPDLDNLKNKLLYNAETGEFQDIVTHRIVGSFSNRYHQVFFEGKQYQAHRVAYYYMTGEDPGDMMVDHIDGNTSNNRFDNLQLVTNQQNQHKSKACNNNPKTINGTFTPYGREWNRQRAKTGRH